MRTKEQLNTVTEGAGGQAVIAELVARIKVLTVPQTIRRTGKSLDYNRRQISEDLPPPTIIVVSVPTTDRERADANTAFKAEWIQNGRQDISLHSISDRRADVRVRSRFRGRMR